MHGLQDFGVAVTAGKLFLLEYRHTVHVSELRGLRVPRPGARDAAGGGVTLDSRAASRHSLRPSAHRI